MRIPLLCRGEFAREMHLVFLVLETKITDLSVVGCYWHVKISILHVSGCEPVLLDRSGDAAMLMFLKELKLIVALVAPKTKHRKRHKLIYGCC